MVHLSYCSQSAPPPIWQTAMAMGPSIARMTSATEMDSGRRERT